jgi:ribosomal protein S7
VRFEEKKIIMTNLNNEISIVNSYSLKKLISAFVKRGQKAKSLKMFLFTLRALNKKKEIKKISALDFINLSLINNIPEVFMMRLRRGSKMFTFPKIINDEKKIKISLF